VEGTKIFDGELGIKLLQKVCGSRLGGTNDDEIIHIFWHIHGQMSLVNEEGHVGFAWAKL
jgi:hypothetical protein